MSNNEFVDFEMNLDLSGQDIKAWNGEGGGNGPQLPVGTYLFQIINIEPGTSKTNNPTMKVTFEVVDGEYAGTKLFPKSYSLNQAALGRFKQLGIAVGARLDAIRGSDYVGQQLIADVAHTEGAPQARPDGTMMPPKIFVDVFNERSAAPAAPATTKTTAKAAAPAAPAEGAAATAVRRAVGNAGAAPAAGARR